MEAYKDKWRTLCIKDRINYITAFCLIGSGIIMAFLSFFLNAFDIATGVLIYIAQCFVIGGSLVGSSVYFRSKFIEFDTRAKADISEKLEKIADNFTNKETA